METTFQLNIFFNHFHIIFLFSLIFLRLYLPYFFSYAVGRADWDVDVFKYRFAAPLSRISPALCCVFILFGFWGLL